MSRDWIVERKMNGTVDPIVQNKDISARLTQICTELLHCQIFWSIHMNGSWTDAFCKNCTMATLVNEATLKHLRYNYNYTITTNHFRLREWPGKKIRQRGSAPFILSERVNAKSGQCLNCIIVITSHVAACRWPENTRVFGDYTNRSAHHAIGGSKGRDMGWGGTEYDGRRRSMLPANERENSLFFGPRSIC